MMKKRKPRIVFFVILTTLTILVWIAADLWRSINKPTPVTVDQSLLKPLNPNINMEVLNSMKSRLFFEDEEARTLSSQIVKSGVGAQGGQQPSPSPAPTPTASPSPSLNPSPSP